MSSLTGLRQRKKRKTRQKLLAAALDLFEQSGFDNTTIEDIVERAGVSRRTFFRYFESKESVAFPDHERRQLLCLESVAELPEQSSPRQRALIALAAVAEAYQSDPEHERRKYRIVQQSKQLKARQLLSMQSWESVIAEVLIGPISAPEQRQRLRILATAMTAVLAALLRKWLEHGVNQQLDLAQLAFGELEQLDLAIRQVFNTTSET